MPDLDPVEQRRFAVDVVRRLREAGFEALWAGGCVRDQLLGLTPKDYDVATSARPQQIRELFGHRRTLALGAAFGVITVLGPKPAGQIEVATFRQDLGYSDGRRPDQVAFSTAAEDARRRDFTINGLFFDPLTDEVQDFVGGRADLEARVIRAIGEPLERFTEDKLRLLRAVRFAAKFDFHLEERTRSAIEQMASEVTVVSPERIAAEMRLMLMNARRAIAVRMLDEVGLLRVLFAPWPDARSSLVPTLKNAEGQRALAVLERLNEPTFALALAALLAEFVNGDVARNLCRQWKLSNRDGERCSWLVAHQRDLVAASGRPWSQVQPLLVHPGVEELLALHEAAGAIGPEDLAFCRQWLAWPRAELDPAPLVNGDDLLRHGLPGGKHFQQLLEAARAAQLDGQIASRAEALALVDRLWSGGNAG